MPRRRKCFLVIAALVVSTAAALFISRQIKPVEQQIMAADSLEFLGEDFPHDGGSRAFFFNLPRRHYLMLKVLHRRSVAEGGNPEFQKIFIQGYRGRSKEVPADSALERKILALLHSATINTNDGQRYSAPAKPERLLWIIDRMQDRKSQW